MATISRLLQFVGLFCKRALQKRLYSAKETCNFKEPTNRSHPIGDISGQHPKGYAFEFCINTDEGEGEGQISGVGNFSRTKREISEGTSFYLV